MSIDRSNYEIYFIDYLDGNLSQSDRKALELFLSENPDLAAELEEGQLPVLEPESASINLSVLIKPLEWEDAEVTELYISQLEAKMDGNVLSETEAYRLAQFEETFPKECERIAALVSKTQLKPNALLVLKEKAKLGLLKLETDAPHTELIAYLEGDLSNAEAKNIEKNVAQHNELASELESLRKAYLPKEVIALPEGFKAQLKRKVGLIIPLWVKSVVASAAAVAAVVLILNGDNESPVTTAFTPRSSTFQDLSYDDSIESETEDSSVNLAEVDAEQSELEGAEWIERKDAAVVPYESDRGLVAENPDSSSNGGGLSPIKELDTTSEELIAMTPKTKAFYLPSKTTGFAGRLVNAEPIEYPEFDINELPVGDDLAEAPAKSKEALTPFEFLEEKVKERLAKDADQEQGMALAFVNRTAKKLGSSDENLIAYEKGDESKNGFKLKLGNLFAVERTN